MTLTPNNRVPIAEAEDKHGTVVIFRVSPDRYDIERDGVVKHPNLTPEECIRALAHYLHK